MLQKYSVQEPAPYEESGSLLTPEYFLGVLKRRFLYFLIPFVLVFVAGATVVAMLPAVYLSEGKILVESQQIPSDLVRPTVTALANERIQVIEQRIMTRDNLLALANKFQLFSGRRTQMSATEMIDFIRRRTQITPLALKLPSRSNSSVAVAFTVGFEHENPLIASRVANEFVTMILNEDVRVRTNFAAETTKFLERESKRLEGELNSVQLKIAELKRKELKSEAPQTQKATDSQLVALKAELIERATRYSDSHPDMKALKARIAALEQANPAKEKETESTELSLDALERREEATQKDLESTNQKLAAARLGESLERGQQSERLEIIEQPVMPQKPVKPNRPKYYAMAFMGALAAGGGLVVLLEALQSTIFRTADILRVVDSHLLVTIPYITTKSELAAQRRKIKLIIAISVLVLFVAAIIALFLLPPLDVLFNSIFVKLGI